MADRSHIISAESAMTGGIRSIRIDVAEDARSATIRQDNVYDTAGDAELAITLRNTTSNPGGILLVGADWSELAGNGQTFRWQTNQEIDLQVFARQVGAWPRGTSVPAASSQEPITGTPVATFQIGEDGWLRPDFRQTNDWYVSFRTLDTPREQTFRYTSFEAVKVILRASPTRKAGFDANFTDRLNQCIYSAEARIDAFCGRTFNPSAQATRSFDIDTPLLIEVDDVDTSHPVSLSYDGRTVASSQYRVVSSKTGYAVGQYVKPVKTGFRLTRWYPEEGKQIMLSARFGWPQVPAEITDYAGRLAAAIFDADAAASGLIGTSDGMAYGRTPGKDMSRVIGHLKKGRAV